MSEVTYQAFQDEIMDAFAAFWAGRTQIESPNRPFDRAKVPESDLAYVAWTIQGETGGEGAGEERWSHSVARNHFSRRGPIVFTANVRDEAGIDPAYSILTDCSKFLETVVTPHAIFQEIGTPLSLGSDGAWWQVSLSAQWLYFTDRPSTLTA